MIWVHKRKESLSTQIISQLSTFTSFLSYLTVMQTPLLCIQTFLLFEELFDAKVLNIGHAVTQNYVFVVFQLEANKNSSND